MFATTSPTDPTSIFPPVEYLRAAAARYGAARRVRVATSEECARVRLDPRVGRAVADAYEAAPVRDPRAYPAYAAFCRETVRQYHFLVGRVEFGGCGLTVRIVDEDPYRDAGEMVADVRERRLRVWSSAATGNAHPYLSDGENDMFRAVHDAFGHAASGRGFDGDGEEAAWLKHGTMYPPLARRAMTTETRGQTCTLIFRYGGRRFPDQKAALLPGPLSDPGRLMAAVSGAGPR